MEGLKAKDKRVSGLFLGMFLIIFSNKFFKYQLIAYNLGLV